MKRSQYWVNIVSLSIPCLSDAAKLIANTNNISESLFLHLIPSSGECLI